jgi:allose kinase
MNAAFLPAGDPAAGRILVIDMGGTHVKFGFVVAGRPKAFAHLVPTQRLRNAHPVASLAAQTREAIALAGNEPDVIVCTVPGFIDEDEDTLLHLRNIPELDGHRLATELGQLLQRPVVLERDATLALLGESAAGCAQDCDLVMGMFFGTGIGAAMVVGGRPFRGCGWALEAGHVPCLLERNGEPDARQPTIEDCASGRALEHIATRHAEPVANVFGAATGKPELAAELERFVQYQALAVDTAVALLAPKVVVLGGGVLNIAHYPRARLARLIEINAPFAKTGVPVNLRWAQLGWTNTLHGAPRVIREHVRRRGSLPAVGDSCCAS